MKLAKPATPATSTNPDSAIRVLKTATCDSLSSRSKVTYQVGCTGKSDIQFRLTGNTGNGFFNSELWISLSDIQGAFDNAGSGKPVTAFSLSSLYKGKSSNSPGFLFAVLKQEGLVRAMQDKPRSYERLDPREFLARIRAHITVDAKPEGAKKATAAVTKPPSKRKA